MQTLIVIDIYKNAATMQVAHRFNFINMQDRNELDRIVPLQNPYFITP
ncbi:MAG: hypothetical protein PSX42_08875 [bacterium]|nr:hypothetical protein [bacterium]